MFYQKFPKFDAFGFIKKIEKKKLNSIWLEKQHW